MQLIHLPLVTYSFFHPLCVSTIVSILVFAGVLELRYSCGKGNEDMPYRKHKCEEILGWEFEADFDLDAMLEETRKNASKKRREAKEAEIKRRASVAAERKRSMGRRQSQGRKLSLKTVSKAMSLL